MNQNDDLHVLIGAYLDGQLAPEQLAALTERLAADRDAVNTFVAVAAADVFIEQYFHHAGIDRAASRWFNSRRGFRLAENVTDAECSACLANDEPIAASNTQFAPWAASRRAGAGFFAAVSLMFILVMAGSIAGWRKWSQPAIVAGEGETNIGVDSALGTANQPTLATLLGTQHVAWAEGHAMTVGERLVRGESIRIASGLVELGLEAGGELILKGPAELEFRSPLEAILHRGTVTAKIEESAHGFRVDTPNANVVDLGTEFGVAVTEGGATDVVVFSGRVEMQIPDDGSASRNPTAEYALASSRLMLSGDGLRVGSRGISRLVAINSSEYPTSVSSHVPLPLSVIDSVTDNLREGDTTKCYRIVPHGLAEDTAAYVDRDHQWNGVDGGGIPDFLVGADYVMPFNDDKLVDRLQVKVSFAAPARLYVFIDQRVPTPDWIKHNDRFVNTGMKIGLDEGDFPNVLKKTGTGAGESIDNVCTVWMMEVRGSGPVTLGSLGVSEEFTSMYGIAATPLVATP